jgi:hypothetical protein
MMGVEGRGPMVAFIARQLFATLDSGIELVRTSAYVKIFGLHDLGLAHHRLHSRLDD